MRFSRLLCSSGLVALSLSAVPALAQQQLGAPLPSTEQRIGEVNGSADQSVSPDRTADPSTSSDQGTPGGGVAEGDIVVTAQRTSSLASKTPVALTAITGDSLTESGVTNPTQIGDVVPNISIDRANGNGLQITIRGITSSDGTEKGDPSAAFMLDGTYIARPQAQEASFFDIARVEVLRGPQGTLFGRNTTAGLVNVITNLPSFELGGRVDATYGNYNQVQTTGVLNVPLSDTIAVRAAVNYDHRDSFITTGTQVGNDLDPFKDNISGRLTGLVKLGNGELVLRGDYSHLGGQLQNGVRLSNFYTNTASGQTPLYVGSSVSSRNLRLLNDPINFGLDRNNDTWGVQADFTYDLGGVGIAYLGSYRELERAEDTAYLRNNNTVIRSRLDGQYKQTSQELRLYTTGTGPVKAQAGAYYFYDESSLRQDLYGLLAATPNTVGYVYRFDRDPAKNTSYAGFGQVTWSVIDALRLTGGVRYSRDDKSRVGATRRCATLSCTGTGDLATPDNAKRSFDKVTWRAGVDFDLNPRTLLYGTVSTGYKAGGFNDGCATGTPNCLSPVADAALYYQPETLTSYEVGFKTRLLDNAVRVNGAAFWYDYKNIQLTQISTLCGGPCSVTTNAAVATVKGVELEGSIRPARPMLFDFSFAYLDATYDRFQLSPTVDFSGRDLDRAPGLTVTAGYTHTFELPGGGNIEANVRTRVVDNYQLAALATFNQYRVPSSMRSDASITFNAPDDRFYVQGFVKNIENAVVVTTVIPGTFPTANFADPRLYGVRGGVKF